MATNVSDLDLAVATLLAKTRHYTQLWDYYESRQPLVYSSKRLEEIFSSKFARFSQNWCAVVVDSLVEKLTLQGITIADNETQSERLKEMLTTSELMLEANDVHLAAAVTGEAYVIAWPDADTGDVEAYYNDPRNVHLFYEADRPRAKRFGAKWWVGDDGFRYLTLYYADRLEYYRSKKRVVSRAATGGPLTNEVSSGGSFEPIDEAGASMQDVTPTENPLGVVPVFHFRRDRRATMGELVNVIEPQNAVNKLLGDMMVAAEFGAFKQRYIISDADISSLKNSPGQVWAVPAGDGEGQATSVGEFDTTPLENYLKAIENWTFSIAIITRTPKHYFFAQGGDPSGEALIALEAPLNHKAQKYIDAFTATWSELGAFMLRADGAGEVNDGAVIPVYEKPETVQPLTEAMIRKQNVDAGVPLVWQLREEGYTDDEIAQLQEDKAAAMAQAQTSLAQAMVAQQRNFDQGGNGNV